MSHKSLLEYYCKESVNKFFMNTKHPVFIGLIQALGIAIYCGIIAGFFQLANEFLNGKPGMVGSVLMLTLLVFSAAITGLIVFGYPTYLAINKEIKKALQTLLYTLLFALVIILAIIFTIVI